MDISLVTIYNVSTYKDDTPVKTHQPVKDNPDQGLTINVSTSIYTYATFDFEHVIFLILQA
jgi:hypothetical protein